MLVQNISNFQFYQSANETDCKLVKQHFIVRKKEFELIMSDLINDPMKDSVQHYLILGRRGSGKSTLLRRIECEISENKALSKRVIAINFAEEQGGIHRLFDLWEEVIRTLKDSGYDNLPETDNLDIPDDFAEYSRQLYGYIQSSLKAKSKKLVLLIDNIDKIFLSFKNDAQILRETLLNFDDIKIIGCSTKMSEHFWQYDSPFYQFFRIIRLEALSKSEIETLLLQWSKLLNENEIKTFLKKNPGQLEAIRILTDGLPRTLQFFVDLLINRPQQNGYEYIKKIMDTMTPLYQERLGSLQAIEQKIVMKLAFFWEAVSVKELVKSTKIESKLLSANLKQLSDNGIVDKIPTGKKNHLYRLSERFFNMWLIVTQGNPIEKRKAEWLTIFLESWYSPQEIKQMIGEHLKDLEIGTKKADHLTMITKALSESKHASMVERDKMIESNLLLESTSDYLKNSLPQTSLTITNKIKLLIDEGKLADAIKETQHISNEAGGDKDFILGIIYHEAKDYKNEEKYYKQAIDKGNIKALFNLAILYKYNEKFELAEKYFKLAIDKGITISLNNLAVLYLNQGKLKLAEKYYKLAINEGFIDALYNLANLYKDQEQLELAEKYYKLAIDKGDTDSFNNLALLYQKQEKLNFAEKYYKQAINIGNVNALNNIAVLYKNRERLGLAEKYYKLAINEGSIYTYYNLISLYYFNIINKTKAKKTLRKLDKKNTLSKKLAILIRLWIGEMQGIQKEIMDLIQKEDGIDELFIKHLLIHHQKNLVWQLFNDKETGEHLKNKYKPLYYAVSQIMDNPESETIRLKIPPEIKETVNDIVGEIERLRLLYYKN